MGERSLGFSVDASLDSSGLLCPAPILMAEEKIAELGAGAVLEVIFTDPGAEPDLQAWCRANHHEFLGVRKGKNSGSAYIRKSRG